MLATDGATAVSRGEKLNIRTKLVWLELIGGIFGWIWIVAGLAAIYFLGTAIFSSSPWSRVWWAVGVSVVSKWLARGLTGC